MTQNNGETPRTRRRAGRPAGPPVEDIGAAAPGSAVVQDTESAAAAAPAVTEEPPAAAGTGAATEKIAKPSAAAGGADAATEQAAVAATGEQSGASGEKAASAEESSAATEKVALTKDTAADAPTVKAAAIPAAADFLGGNAGESGGKRGPGRIVALAASVLLVLALVVGAGASFYLVHSNNQREDRRTEYIQAARQAVLNLTTIRADSAKEDVDRILATASGKFKTEFDGRVDPFLQIVQQAKVVSNGEIIEAALVRDDENQATVLVAAKQTLTNAGSNEPQTRFYRFRITVDRTDSGMSASNVEFVA
ncbi:hypothetical protein [Nocardia sp. NPDC048505]|uniref:hypothetical protein n=1 Tax=unclassified Nocardia TaxID=2637762 RepID=UPI0033D85362